MLALSTQSHLPADHTPSLSRFAAQLPQGYA